MESSPATANFSKIETEELSKLLEESHENLKLVNATCYFGEGKPDPLKQFEEAHIKGSVHFSIIDIADKSTGLTTTLPKQEDWINQTKRLGIKRTNTIVIYEHQRILAGPRAAWMFRIYGATDVRLLNGTTTTWIEEGRPTETSPHTDINDTSDEGYDYEFNESMYDTLRSTLRKGYDIVNQVGGHEQVQLVDVRPEPSVTKGSIPGFANSFCEKYLNEGKTKFKTKADIMNQFTEDGVDLNKALTFSCG